LFDEAQKRIVRQIRRVRSVTQAAVQPPLQPGVMMVVQGGDAVDVLGSHKESKLK